MPNVNGSDMNQLRMLAEAGERVGCYRELERLGEAYGRLAAEVVEGSSLTGRAANIHLAEHAAAAGVILGNAEAEEVGRALLEADFQRRSDRFKASGGDIYLSREPIRQYHLDVFRERGIPKEAWTAWTPLEVAARNRAYFGKEGFAGKWDSEDEAMDSMWDHMVSGRVGLVGRMMNFASTYEGDDEATDWLHKQMTQAADEPAYLAVGHGSPYPPDDDDWRGILGVSPVGLFPQEDDRRIGGFAWAPRKRRQKRLNGREY